MKQTITCDTALAEALEAAPAPPPPAVAAHLAACARCRSELAALRRADEAIRHYTARLPVVGLQNARASVRRRATPRGRLRALALPLLRVAPVGVMAALLAALGLVLFTTYGHTLLPQRDGPSAAVVVTGQDRLWLADNASLVNAATPTVRVGYQLVSAPTAILSLRLVGEGEGRFFCPAIMVLANSREAEVPCPLDAARVRALLGNGPLHWEATLRAADADGTLVLLRRERFEQVVEVRGE